MDSTSGARRLLLPNSSPPATFTTANPTESSRFDAKVIMIISVVLCALIFSLILNSIIRCTFKCFHPVPATAADHLSGEAKLANTGIKKRALKTFPVVTFSDGLDLDVECVICLSEFAGGDRVKILPLCNHGFHVECIDQWLGSHSSCPTCRHSVVKTCRKSVAPIVAAAAAAEEVVVSMPVVEAEGPVREHWMIRSVFFWRKN